MFMTCQDAGEYLHGIAPARVFVRQLPGTYDVHIELHERMFEASGWTFETIWPIQQLTRLLSDLDDLGDRYTQLAALGWTVEPGQPRHEGLCFTYVTADGRTREDRITIDLDGTYRLPAHPHWLVRSIQPIARLYMHQLRSKALSSGTLVAPERLLHLEAQWAAHELGALFGSAATNLRRHTANTAPAVDSMLGSHFLAGCATATAPHTRQRLAIAFDTPAARSLLEDLAEIAEALATWSMSYRAAVDTNSSAALDELDIEARRLAVDPSGLLTADRLAQLSPVRHGITIGRDRLDAWTGSTLTDEQVARIADALGESTVPDALAAIAHTVRPSDLS